MLDLARSRRRVVALAAKEARHIVRDPRTLYLALAMPVLLLVLFGYAISFDVDRVPLAVIDRDGTAASRWLTERFVASGELEVAAADTRMEAAEELMREGEVLAALIIPQGFSRDLARGEAGEIQVLVDGSDGNTASQVLAKAEAIVAAAGVRMSGAAQASAPVEVRVITLYNPTGRSALFLVPGLTAYLLAIVAVLLTALTVSREWERGSMEQLFATPVGRFEIIMGKLLPYLALGVVQVLLVLAVGAWVFEVPIRGSILTLAASSLLFLVGMLAQGLFVSVVARNQIVATQAATMTSVLPSLLLSGLIFPIDNMPAPLRVLSSFVPARYYVSTLRGVLLRGNGFAELWLPLLAMAGFAVLMLALSTRRFERQLA